MWKLFGFIFVIFVVHGNCQISQSKSCGYNSVPYFFNVDLNGSPEIQCEIPPCFGSSSGNEEPYEFGNRNMIMRRRRHKKSLGDRIAECTGRFSEQVCSQPDEWTSGVMDYNNGTHLLLKAECCSYDGLNNASYITTKTLRPGENYVGGNVLEHNKLVAFDLIKEVRKNVDASNQAVYVVTIYRMICIPDPIERRNKVSSYFDNDGIYDSEDFGLAGYRMRSRADEYALPYSNNRRYRPMYRSQIRRRPYPRRRYYRPVFDEYDYYDFEPLPVVRRPLRRPYRPRYETESYYGPKQRARAYGEAGAYGGSPQTEPLEAYPDHETKNPLPAAYGEQPYSPPPQNQLPLPDTQQSSFLAPPPTLPGYVTPSSYLPPPPPPPQIQASYNAFPSYQPSPQSSSCVADPCSAAASQSQNAYSNNYAQSGYGQSSGGGADLNSVFSSLQCFSGDMTVQTPSGFKRMDELEIGDMVLSIEQSMISYTPVVMFLHNERKEVATFKEIETADHKKLKLTDFHLIYVTSCKIEPFKLIHAKDVKVGQCVHIVDDSQQSLKSSEVIAIRNVEEVGIYAPLTASGDVMVNQVLASCHSNMGIQTLQQTFFSWYRKVSVTLVSIRNMFGIESSEEAGSLPYGIKYLTSALDVIVPKSLFS